MNRDEGSYQLSHTYDLFLDEFLTVWWIFNCIVIPTKWIYFSKKNSEWCEGCCWCWW